MSHSACTVSLNLGLLHFTGKETEADPLLPKMTPEYSQGSAMIPTVDTRNTKGKEVEEPV